MKRKIVPGKIPTKDLHQYIIGAVAPRPIAFVSTTRRKWHTKPGALQLFNAFSSIHLS
ncbi:MAG: hypothetical protein IPO26_18360 [Saprospiraceae bacterium]|nr:hypothetical protein [Saprospiraceae bacterium]